MSGRFSLRKYEQYRTLQRDAFSQVTEGEEECWKVMEAFDRCARTQELSLKETEAILRNKKSVQTFVDSFRQDNPVSKSAPVTQEQFAEFLDAFIIVAQYGQETQALVRETVKNTDPAKTAEQGRYILKLSIGWSAVIGLTLTTVGGVVGYHLAPSIPDFKKAMGEVLEEKCPPSVQTYQAPQGTYWFSERMPPFLIPRYPGCPELPDRKPKLEP